MVLQPYKRTWAEWLLAIVSDDGKYAARDRGIGVLRGYLTKEAKVIINIVHGNEQ